MRKWIFCRAGLGFFGTLPVATAPAGHALNIIQFTSRGLHPDISGSKVAWPGLDGADGEIYLCDGSTTTQIADTDTADLLANISGWILVWDHCDGGRSVR